MNAEEARSLVKTAMTKNNDLEFCLSRIKQMAEVGCSSVVINTNINREAQTKLKELGYTVEADEYNDLYIKW